MADEPFEEYRHGYENAARFYNLFADNVDLPFYTEYAQKQGGPILDLAAGTGRVSIALAKNGFEIFALESSVDMISEFKSQLSHEEKDVIERIELQEGDMTNFDLGRKFPLIIIPTSFGHALTSKEQLSLLACAREHLSDDGIFIIDLFPGGIQPRSGKFTENPVEIDDGKTVTRSGIITSDPVSQIMSLELTYTVRNDSGEVLEEIHQKSGAALVYNREMDLLLRISELKIIEEFGDFKKRPYTIESGKRILIIKKK